MSQKTLPSFNVQIWCGLKEGYDGITHTIEEVEGICQKYVDTEKNCVTVTPTTFIYVNGKEPGFVIGFISYPRFPMDQIQILNEAIKLANILLNELKQNRLTITTPQESIMFESEDHA